MILPEKPNLSVRGSFVVAEGDGVIVVVDAHRFAALLTLNVGRYGVAIEGGQSFPLPPRIDPMKYLDAVEQARGLRPALE